MKLPAYTLVNAGMQFGGRRWSVTVAGKNLTDERYFRANFPNLFGGVVVLPELPRHFQATVAWKFDRRGPMQTRRRLLVDGGNAHASRELDGRPLHDRSSGLAATRRRRPNRSC